MTVMVLLCGGIGSGKSTAAGLLAARGAHVVSADEAGHRVLEPGAEAYGVVVRRWPESVSDGRIDRSVLAQMVFADPRALAELEAVTHPAIRRLIAEEIRTVSAPMVVVEVPVLSGFLGDDWIRVVVDAPDGTRIDRLRERGMDPADIERRMAAQPSRMDWIRAADHVIDNSEDLAHLESECRRVWGILVGPASPDGGGGAAAPPG